MNHPSLSHSNRHGFSFLELQVSLILLGIALSGLVPLVVIQSKQLKALERPWNSEWTASDALQDVWIDPYHAGFNGPVYDLVPPGLDNCPQANPWARKLGASARIVPRPRTGQGSDPEVRVAGGWVAGETKYIVTINAGTVTANGTGSRASATVVVTPIPEPTP